MKKTLLILAMAGALTACGGSSSDNGSTNPPSNGGTPPTGSKSMGTLTNGGIVAGVHYKTSSGEEDKTNDKGEFTYKPGDTISFSLGNIQLGNTVKAKATITPADLSQDRKIQENLVAFIQSLDADSKKDGVQIGEKTINALKSIAINFGQSTAQFANDPAVKQVITASGTTQISIETAKENLKKTFYADIAGVWQMPGGNAKEKILLYINPEGDYIMGQATPKDEDGKPGIETGNFTIDPISYQIRPKVKFDGNDSWGFNDAADDNTVFLSYGTTKDTLVLHTPDEDVTEHVFTKVPSQNNSLIGSWQMPDHIVSFFSDNSYFLLYTGVYDAVKNDCADRGLEYGKYNATSNTLKASEIYYDTTGCSGLVDTDDRGRQDMDTFNFKIIGDQLSLQYENEAPGVFQRIK